MSDLGGGDGAWAYRTTAQAAGIDLNQFADWTMVQTLHSKSGHTCRMSDPRASVNAACDVRCDDADTALMNSACGCTVLSPDTVRAALNQMGGQLASFDPVRHAPLVSPYAVFVGEQALQTMSDVAAAVQRVATLPGLVRQSVSWAPALAQIDPGSAGGVLGLDFHLTERGPRLIEVNTNPGGLLVNAAIVGAVAQCAPLAWAAPHDGTDATDEAVRIWLEEATLQLGCRPMRMAIVDTSPAEQFLAPEFELYARRFQQAGVACVISEPDALRWEDGALQDAEGRIDFVYNRLTDFGLERPEVRAIAEAFRNQRVALSPHPRAHAILADKRVLTLLADPELVLAAGGSQAEAAALFAAIPETVVVEPANHERLWQERAQYFFKPAGGYGSRGSYRGDKMTRRVWESLLQSPHVAQRLVAPSLRVSAEGQMLKADVRCYTGPRGTLLFAARLYQGQTTNMRTPGGGFAPVLTRVN